ncbi:HEAT repeat domain-containing protein [Streptomyces antimicrobicus]|uniref:HEAT repeat domain-containing protein n=1 Tax=Streptomyces antimicrobicus TaxID=2883108 RepID=A0ABS8BCS8_9ACTN|nr:HEAT repeat domain-containing protein [Streptomyces antimicrobicus]MCB5182451.1 HEAT repeat domain-containing protein [Streptomyces antimicrobicus]
MQTDGHTSGAAEDPLVAAAKAGDKLRVKQLLEEADDRCQGDRKDPTAAFAAALQAFHTEIADTLLRLGAQPADVPPEELPSLRQAVDFGSPALVDALTHSSIRHRYPRTELNAMRDLARAWHEAGTEAELRRRTGSSDTIARTRVQDDEYCTVGELTLAGTTVRDGHGAILTHLEKMLGIRTSCQELVARALERDADHTAWSRAAIELSHRRQPEAWATAETLRADADPLRRLFGAELTRLFEVFADSHDEEYCVLAVAALTDWATAETDPTVLAEVLHGLSSYQGPRAEAALLLHTHHHVPAVRRAVAAGLGTPPHSRQPSDAAHQALLTLMNDPDTDVQIAACHSAGDIANGDRALTDTMASLLDHPERRVQLQAVHALARHHDERCVQAAERLGPPRPGYREDETYYLEAAWRYERPREDTSPG